MFFEIPSQVNTAISLLNSAGYCAYVVGGAVRDLVMGKTPNDWDITTSALPEETKKVFEKYKCVETGIKHGTVLVVFNEMSLEITTFRIDGDYTDHRRPDNVLFTDKLYNDLSRRDFTVNALAYHPQEGVVDYFGGIDDIKNQVIKCVGEATVRFDEDALRVLRALRFASVLDFEIEVNTQKAIFEKYPLLEFISAERIFAELKKLLCGKNVKNVLLDFEDVMFFIIPELKETKNCTQNHERHIFDVWGHTVACVATVKPEPELRFAMLLHDIGKPMVKSTDDKWVDHFYNHAAISTEIARDILDRLKCSNAFKNEVLALVKNHGLMLHQLSKKTFKKYIAEYGLDTVEKLFEVREADCKGQNPKFLQQCFEENEIGKQILTEILKNESCFSLKDLQINGSDLIDLGYESSPKMGEVLSQILSEVMDNKLPNDKTLLLDRAKELLDEN